MIDRKIQEYRTFSLEKRYSSKFKHLYYLLYWPIYGVAFLTVERLWIRDSYYPIHCALDDYVPFCEYFLIPYLFWFVFLMGMLVYTFFFDVNSFEKMMQFIIITYSATILIYIIFPNCQELRPMTFERDNILVQFIAEFYKFDTNTNVCPSLHVIGSVAAMLCAWNTPRFNTKGWRWFFAVMALLISISTVFLKQHSVLDVVAAVPICLIGYWLIYRKKTTIISNSG